MLAEYKTCPEISLHRMFPLRQTGVCGGVWHRFIKALKIIITYTLVNCLARDTSGQIYFLIISAT